MSRDPELQILTEALQEILADAAFLFVEPVDDPPAWGDTLIEVTLPFSGRVRGRIRLRATAAFGSALAAGLLGLEEDDAGVSPERAADALAELVNMGAGMLAARWAEGARIGEIGIPQVRVRSPEADRLAGLGRSPVARLCSDGGERIEFSIDRNAA